MATKEDLYKLTKLNQIVIKNEDVNNFFSTLVLSRRLKGNLGKFAILIKTVYDSFNEAIKDSCKSVKMYVETAGQNLLLNLYFNCEDYKYMLVFYLNSDKNITEQAKDVFSLFLDETDQPTLMSVYDPKLPVVVSNLVKQINNHIVDKYSLSVVKINNDDSNIVFNQVNFPLSLSTSSGLSILSVFMYPDITT